MTARHQIKIRLPDAMLRWVRDQAAVNRRSMTAEIQYRLETLMVEERAAASKRMPIASLTTEPVPGGSGR